MATTGQKLLAAGPTLVIAESALAMAHMGGVGAIVGIVAGALAYVAVDDIERMAGRDFSSLPTSQATSSGDTTTGQEQLTTPQQGKQQRYSLAYRIFNGKSTRERDEADQQQTNTEDGNAYKERNEESIITPLDEILQLGYLAKVGTLARFDPHMDMLLGKGLIVAGVQGMGKSNIAALVIESASRCDMPVIMFDLKREYHTIVDVARNAMRAGHESLQGCTPGYFVLTEKNADEFATLVMTGKHQAIIDLPSYGEDLNVCAKVMAAVLKALMKWSKGLRDTDRLPCLTMLDEAQVFLPQDQTLSPLSRETLLLVQAAFWQMCNMGRSMGYTMCFFTQSIANLQKWAIKNCQCKVVGIHVEKNDLDRCVEEVDAEIATREHIKTMPKGVGVVIGFTPSQILVKFDKRVSRHVSNTPDLARLRKPLVEQRVRSQQVQPYIPSATTNSAEKERLQFAQDVYSPVNEKTPVYDHVYSPVNVDTGQFEASSEQERLQLHRPGQGAVSTLETTEEGVGDVNVNAEKRETIRRMLELRKAGNKDMTDRVISECVGLGGTKYKSYMAVRDEILKAEKGV